MDGIFRIAEEKVAYMSVKATFRPRSGRTDKEFTTGKNLKIGIEIVGVRTIQPIEENQCAATGDSRENLKRGHAFKPSNLPSSVYPHSGEAMSLYGEVLCSAGLSHAVIISIASLCRRRFTKFTRGVQTHLSFDSDILIL